MNMNSRQKLICTLLALTAGVAAIPSARADEPGIKRYLVGSLNGFAGGDFHQKQGHTNFHAKPEQGVFVYDINNGNKLVERFPAKLWTSWSAGWAGVAAHAGTGVFFQVEDGKAIRAYDFLGKKLLWERGLNTPADKQWADASADHDLRTRAFQYIDRRFAVTKDGRHLIVPDRDSAKKKDAKSGKPLGLGVPVVRVLDAQTGAWVKNIALVDPAAQGKTTGGCSPHMVLAMRRYIYASEWNDGHVYCIDPATLEVARRLGPVVLGQGGESKNQTVSDAQLRGTEEAHGSQSIQHFSVDEAEKYVFVEPVKAFGLGMIEVASGKFLGHWPLPPAAPDSLLARRQAIKEAQGNQLHSKANHGIAARPHSTEVWMTDDNWGVLHVWDAATVPPKYMACVPVFEDIKQPIYDFSWVSFSIDGKYCYASNKVIDADKRKVVAKLNGLNEASVEIQIKDGKVIRTGHDGGSGLDTWREGYDLPAK
jgi:hypothetical protein